METISNVKKKNERVINGLKLNLLVLVFMIPMVMIAIVPFGYLHGWPETIREIHALINLKIIVLLFLGIAVHEFLHGFTWMILLSKGFKTIKFGFNPHSLSPYTHCKEPMAVWKYRLGGLMPGLIMGIIPVILSFIFNSTALNFIGFLFMWAAGGDFISLFMLRKLARQTMVLDHPDEMGFIIIDE